MNFHQLVLTAFLLAAATINFESVSVTAFAARYRRSAQNAVAVTHRNDSTASIKIDDIKAPVVLLSDSGHAPATAFSTPDLLKSGALDSKPLSDYSKFDIKPADILLSAPSTHTVANASSLLNNQFKNDPSISVSFSPVGINLPAFLVAIANVNATTTTAKPLVAVQNKKPVFSSLNKAEQNSTVTAGKPYLNFTVNAAEFAAAAAAVSLSKNNNNKSPQKSSSVQHMDVAINNNTQIALTIVRQEPKANSEVKNNSTVARKPSIIEHDFIRGQAPGGKAGKSIVKRTRE